MTVANSKGLRPKPWCIPTPTPKTSLLRGLRGIVLEWFQLCLSCIEHSMSCSVAVHCPSSTSSAQCCKAQYWVSTVHRVHSIPCSCCGEAWYISTHVRWRHTAVSTLSSRWHNVSCCSAGTIHHIRRTLDVRQLPYNTDKTELLWVGSRHSLSQQDCCPPVSQLGPDSIVARDYVRLLGVTLSSDLSFDWHVSIISTSSFYWLRQLQRSLDMESAATLVHSFVASRVDYCNTLLAGVPKVTINKLQECWTNVTAREVSGMHKFDRGLSWLLHTDLHWLDVMFPSESCISSASWRSTACTVKHLHTSWNCTNQLQMSRRSNISDLPPDS